jgi:tellurite resistance protein TerC
MLWFWIGFFTLVALLLVLDLAVLNRNAQHHGFRRSLMLTLFWTGLGLAFSGFVYLMYENHWMGATMRDAQSNAKHSGLDAAIIYLSAYLLELALSVDNLFVMSLIFRSFKVPHEHQHRVLFWGILGAVVFRVAMLGGGAYLANNFTWVFYVFGGYLILQGLKMFKPEGDDDDKDPLDRGSVRFLRKFFRIVEGKHDGHFVVRDRGRRAFTTLFVCLIIVELTDIVFALDSIPAVLAISRETFIMVTSNIFAILGLRSMYSVLAGAMNKFHYLKYALAVLLVIIGLKMIAHGHIHIPHAVSLSLIAGIIGTGVLVSIIATRKSDKHPPAAGADAAAAVPPPTATAKPAENAEH